MLGRVLEHQGTRLSHGVSPYRTAQALHTAASGSQDSRKRGTGLCPCQLKRRGHAISEPPLASSRRGSSVPGPGEGCAKTQACCARTVQPSDEPRMQPKGHEILCVWTSLWSPQSAAFPAPGPPSSRGHVGGSGTASPRPRPLGPCAWTPAPRRGPSFVPRARGLFPSPPPSSPIISPLQTEEPVSKLLGAAHPCRPSSWVSSYPEEWNRGSF